MVDGQAHAPVFRAKLTVPGGKTVSATGSSKKIAKNQAAIEMLKLLERPEVGGRCEEGGQQVAGIQETMGRVGLRDTDEVESRQGRNDTRVSLGIGEMTYAGKKEQLFLARLVKDGVVAVPTMERLVFLEQLVEEQGMRLVLLEVGRQEGRVQWLGQVCEEQGTTAIVCVGEADDDLKAKTKAVGAILTYFHTIYSNV